MLCWFFCCTMKWISRMYTYISFLLNLPPISHFHPALLEHQAELLATYSGFPIAISFTYSTVYISVPLLNHLASLLVYIPGSTTLKSMIMMLFKSENDIIIFSWSKFPVDSCHSKKKKKKEMKIWNLYQSLPGAIWTNLRFTFWLTFSHSLDVLLVSCKGPQWFLS